MSTKRSGIVDILRRRGSVRDFLADPVDPETVDAIVTAARQAPTSSNLQAYSIVVVRDAQRRARLADLSGGQQHVETAPVFLAFCGDVNRLRRIAEEAGESFAADTLEMLLVASLDAGLAGMCASLAADSLGLGSVMIGGVRNDPEGVAEVLNLPSGVYAVFGLCIGWPGSRPDPKLRLPATVTVHDEQYELRPLAAPLAAYSEALRRQGVRHRASDLTWHARVAHEMVQPRRKWLADALRRRGFRF